jgi:hypothetical protein
MIHNFTNINQTNNHLTHPIIVHKETMTNVLNVDHKCKMATITGHRLAASLFKLFFHNKNYEKGYPMIVSVYFWVNEL